jgi:ATP-dependent RNA helicase TDRD9
MADPEIPQSLVDDWYTMKPIDQLPQWKPRPETDIRTKRMLQHSEKQRKRQEDEMRKRRAERERKEREMKEIAESASEYSRVVAEAARPANIWEAGQEDNWVSYDFDSMQADREPTRDDHFGPLSTVDTFANYNFDHAYDPALPMTENREKVLKCIEENPVTVVTGPTGSGKTTQVPQYIMDKCAAEMRHCNIVCTQPRKIAAVSIARRVCQERNWKIGTLVGYQVQMHREFSEDTRLMYVTTGVLLRKLVTNKHMNMYTHVIIDEVHERDQDTDFVMLVVRKFLRSNSQGVKVILMSATIESEMFAGYFSSVVGNRLVPAPVVSVEGKVYPVVEFYSDDMKFLGKVPSLKYEKPELDNIRIQLCGDIIRHFDLVEASNPRDERFHVLNRGTVLVFLPGLVEITRVDNYLKQELKQQQLWIIPLHSSITIEEQRQAFVQPQAGQRKVILSTNIAESSITIPDIKYVIDFCLTKELKCDLETNYQALMMNWASMASMTQRKGRAGRCSGGRCYRLISRKFRDTYIQEYSMPEMQRCPLDHLVLQAKLLDLGEPKLILGLALQPPHLEDIEKTILCLKEVGALSTLKSGVANPYDGDLTFVGRVLATLPVDIHLGKLIILGHVFGCIEEAIIVAAAFSMKTFFAHPYQQELDAYKAKLSWADYSHSDAIAALRAYQVWHSLY